MDCQNFTGPTCLTLVKNSRLPGFFRALAIVCLGTVVLIQSGCAVGRRTVDLSVPAAPDNLPLAGSISLAGIEDRRTFENKPSDPSTPSIDGDVATLTPEMQSQMIGRQRGGYGNALGDVALPEGTTIEEKVEEMAANALAQLGYDLVNDASEERMIAINVTRFWAWLTPGFVAIKVDSVIEAEVTLTSPSGSRTFTVDATAREEAAAATDAVWQRSYEALFTTFIDNLVVALQQAGLEPAGNPAL